MRTRFLFRAIAALLLLVGCPSAAWAQCRQGADLAPIENALAHVRFIAYQPTELTIINGVAHRADDASIRADLKVLRSHFDGLITYGALNGNERVPMIATELGFHAVILGVWSLSDPIEMANALAAWRAHPNIVLGLNLGNEIVYGKRGQWSDLSTTLDRIHGEAPGIALSVSEPFAQFLDGDGAIPTLSRMDFMMVNIHPIFQPWFRTAPPANWADFVAKVSERLEKRYCGPILIKETGTPTGPEPLFNESMQKDFWKALRARMLPTRRLSFAYFSAFDAPWRMFDFNPTPGAHPEETTWGLYTVARAPKSVVAEIPPLP